MRKFLKSKVNRIALAVGACSLVATPIAIVVSCSLGSKQIEPDEIDKWAYIQYRKWYDSLSNEEMDMFQTYTQKDASGQLWNVFLHRGNEKALEDLAKNGVSQIKSEEYQPCIGQSYIPTVGYKHIDNALSRNKVGYFDPLTKEKMVVYHAYEFYETEILDKLYSALRIKSLKDYDLSRIDEIYTYRLNGVEITSTGYWATSMDKKSSLDGSNLRKWNAQVGEAWNVCPIYEVELDPELTGAYLSLPQIKHNNELLAPHDRHMFLINRNFKLRINDAQLIKKEDDQGIYYQLLIKCKASLIEE